MYLSSNLKYFCFHKYWGWGFHTEDGVFFGNCFLTFTDILLLCSLQDFGDEIYTIQAVVREIRDKQTRSRLQVLPYTLNFREPSPQSISHGKCPIVQHAVRLFTNCSRISSCLFVFLLSVNEIAKRTGDFRSLSATDIRIIALTYELHEEVKGSEVLSVSYTPVFLFFQLHISFIKVEMTLSMAAD